MIDVTDLTNCQRRCVWSVGRFGSWDLQSARYRKECLDLSLIERSGGLKLTPSGKEIYRTLVSLSENTGTYLRKPQTQGEKHRMNWPHIFTVPDGPQDMCKRRFRDGRGCRCASGWLRLSIPHDIFPKASMAFRIELMERMLGKLTPELQKEAKESPNYCIPELNDNYLTLAQSAEAVQETAAHFGFTVDA